MFTEVSAFSCSHCGLRVIKGINLLQKKKQKEMEASPYSLVVYLSFLPTFAELLLVTAIYGRTVAPTNLAVY